MQWFCDQFGIAVPGFGQGRGALLELAHVARPFFLADHVVEHVAASGVGKGTHDVHEADVAGGDAIAVGAEHVHQVLQHGRSPVFRDQSQHQRHGVGGLAVAVVLVRVGMEECSC